MYACRERELPPIINNGRKLGNLWIWIWMEEKFLGKCMEVDVNKSIASSHPSSKLFHSKETDIFRITKGPRKKTKENPTIPISLSYSQTDLMRVRRMNFLRQIFSLSSRFFYIFFFCILFILKFWLMSFEDSLSGLLSH